MSATPLSEQQISQVKSESLAQINPIIESARSISISNAATYLAADTFLGQIRSAKRTIEERLRPVIDPIRKGLDKLYELKRDLDSPLDAAEAEVKGKMKTYKIAENERIRKQDEERRAEEQRRLREQQEIEPRRAAAERAAVEAEIRANAAKNDALREQARREAQVLRAQAEKEGQTLTPPPPPAPLPPPPTRADFSKTRKIRRWRLADKSAFVAGVVCGDIPDNMLQIDTVEIGVAFRNTPDWVATWPGIEVYEDVDIVGR